MTKIRENGATSGVGVLATFAYDDLGRRTSTRFGNGVAQALGYDPVSRLASLTNNLSGTTNDLSQTFAYSPASQITQTVRTGDAYAWTGHFNTNVTGTANGLNQLTSVGPKTLTHDTKGNVTAFGTKSFTYSSENLMLTGPNSTTLSYDPGMRLYQVASGGTTTRMAYDGLDRIAEYNGSNVLQRRYVHAPDLDEPLVWYEGSGTTDRRFLSSDERGSIISLTDSSGALLGLNRYDEFGNPQSTNLGNWGYTGQAWVPEIGEWYYKARMYDPELGRFPQTDPIEYGNGFNLYAYVGNDPVNFIDPLGLRSIQVCVEAIIPMPYADVVMWFCDYDRGEQGRGSFVELGGIVGRGGGSEGGGIPGGLIGFGAGSGEDKPTCPSGPRISLSAGPSITGFLGLLGVSFGAEGNVSIPLESLSNFSLRGTQIGGTISATGLAGFGAYAGVGGNYSLGITQGPAPSGFSSSVIPVLQLGAGAGGGVEVSAGPFGMPGSKSYSVSAGGKASIGAYGAGGIRGARTFMTEPLGC